MKDFRSRFGFHATPFTREIPVDRCLTFSQYDEALDALVRVVDHRMSGALIAPAGTGKTTVLRRLVERLPDARYRVHYVKVTNLSKRDMCREIARAMGAKPAGSYAMLVQRLQERFLAAADTDGLRPVLILDEAHDMRPDVLGMLRILTNFAMDSRLVVSLVLAGQGALRTVLRRDDLEDVARRLAHIATLRVLSRDELQAYIEHRSAVAGAVAFPFDAAAVDGIHEIGRGNLRATDRLALKSLEIAHNADKDVVGTVEVVEARKCLWA
jgi:type II secretory pathway predicted ATPase ExeA